MLPLSLVLVAVAGGLLALNIPGSEAVECYSDFNEITGGCTEYLGDDVSEDDCCLNIMYSFKNDPDEPCQACRPAQWSKWTAWSPCTVSCLEGVQRRHRVCTGQGNCDGDSVEMRSCTDQDCCPSIGGWSDWSSWSDCSVTCEKGLRKRSRECNNPEPSCGGGCIGISEQIEECDTQQICPTHGAWGSWGSWGQCTSHCATEGSPVLPVQTRQRLCNNPLPSKFPPGNNCVGEPVEVRDCTSLPFCPVNGEWGPWVKEPGCTVTCGVGVVRENRVCNNPAPKHGGRFCVGPPSRKSTCNTKVPCPIDGAWSEWEEWAPCTRLGEDKIACKKIVGTQQRRRVCEGERNNGKWCEGDRREMRHCYNREKCFPTTKSQWSEWSEWGLCSPHCGKSERTRQRVCEPVHPDYPKETTTQSERVVEVFFWGTPVTNCQSLSGSTKKVEEKEECKNVPEC
ncbi:properdin [Bombina bombina]|uniref:properdin n=1 Tax=Bombina bombina TaxID=8345 RepID=UPI00235B0B8F|nr:properdin [Bombina bombina]